MRDYTEIVFILDRSGSMRGLEADTIGGFNAMLEKNKKAGGKALVSTVLFDHKVDVICDRRNIKDVEPLTGAEYFVRGSTALLDAVGGSIERIAKVQKELPKHHRASNVLFVITTDGMENASVSYGYDDVFRLIEKKKEKGWEFLFMGANIDAAAEAGRIGIARNRAATYKADRKGTAVLYEAMSDAVSNMCARGCVGASWSDDIEADTAERA